MRMGPTDAECTVACIDIHGATYVLLDGKDVYALSDQRTPEKFAHALQLGVQLAREVAVARSRLDEADVRIQLPASYREVGPSDDLMLPQQRQGVVAEFAL